MAALYPLTQADDVVELVLHMPAPAPECDVCALCAKLLACKNDGKQDPLGAHLHGRLLCVRYVRAAHQRLSAQAAGSSMPVSTCPSMARAHGWDAAAHVCMCACHITHRVAQGSPGSLMEEPKDHPRRRTERDEYGGVGANKSRRVGEDMFADWDPKPILPFRSRATRGLAPPPQTTAEPPAAEPLAAEPPAAEPPAAEPLAAEPPAAEPPGVVEPGQVPEPPAPELPAPEPGPSSLGSRKGPCSSTVDREDDT